jgi:hypothetical protein
MKKKKPTKREIQNIVRAAISVMVEDEIKKKLKSNSSTKPYRVKSDNSRTEVNSKAIRRDKLMGCGPIEKSNGSECHQNTCPVKGSLMRNDQDESRGLVRNTALTDGTPNHKKNKSFYVICGRCGKRRKKPGDYICKHCQHEDNVSQWGRGY